MTTSHTEVVQATGNLHDLIGNPLFREAQNIFNDATPLDPGDDMFDDHPGTGKKPIEKPICSAQFLTFWLFLGCRVCTPGGS